MRRSPSAYFASIGLLLVWLSSPILAVAHVLAAEHRFCAEHERMEEATVGHAPGVEEKGPERDASARLCADQTEKAPAGHEVCAFGDSFTLDDAFTLPLGMVVEPALATAASPVLAKRPVASTLPLLRIAPKSSPPHFA